MLHIDMKINFILSFRVETKVAAFYTGGKVQVNPFRIFFLDVRFYLHLTQLIQQVDLQHRVTIGFQKNIEMLFCIAPIPF